VPVTATEKRKGRAKPPPISTATAAHHLFRVDGHRAMLEGAQDKATVPFQLGAIGRADVNQLAGDIDIQVGEERKPPSSASSWWRKNSTRRWAGW
jgi:hypothetical protein